MTTTPFRRFLRLVSAAALAVAFAALARAQPSVPTPAVAFTAAESGRTYMTVGGVWNGTSEVTATTGDTFSVTYVNSGDATAYDFKPTVELPTNFAYVSGTAAVVTSPSTPGLTLNVSQVGQVLTFTPRLSSADYDLPAGTSITVTYGVRATTSVTDGTYQLKHNRSYSLTNGGSVVAAVGNTLQPVLVQAGATTLNVTPKQQIKAVGETASFTVTVTNTGLGGLFDVKIDESAINPSGGNLAFVSLAQTSPALAATASNGGSVLTLPYLAPGQSFVATAQAAVLSCGTIVNVVATTDRTGVTAATDQAPVQLNLQQPLVGYTPPAIALNYTAATPVSLTVNNTGQGDARSFALHTTFPARAVTISGVGAGWSYNATTGVFTYTANGGTIANSSSATLTFNVAATDICADSGAGSVSYEARYTNACGDAYVIPQQTGSIAAAANTPSLGLAKEVSSSRIAIVESGYYTLTLSATNLANITTDPLVVTDTLPAGITYTGHVASVGVVNVVGQLVTWTVAKADLATSRTLRIDFTVNNEPCLAGTFIANTANVSAVSVRGCALAASGNASFLVSNNPGLASSQFFNVTPDAADGVFETGNPTANAVRDAGEGEFIPFEANYSFGAAYPGTWVGTTYEDDFGGITQQTLVPGTLVYSFNGGAATAVPGGSVTALASGFRIDLSFLGTAAAGTSLKINYSTTVNDAGLAGNATRGVTQRTNLVLAGISAGSVPGGICPESSTKFRFTQGAFYTIGRAAGRVGLSMASQLEVCREETLTITVDNATVEKARNLLVTLLNNGTPFIYPASQTPVYGGAFNSGNIVYSANAGVNPTFEYTGNPLNASGTIQVKVLRRATSPVNTTGFSARVAYDSWQTAAAAARVYNATANYAPSVVRKASLALTVTPGTITVAGQTASYVLYVTNTDAGAAYGAKATATLPAGVTPNAALMNAANAGADVVVAGQNLEFDLGDLASGATVQRTIIGDVGTVPGCAITITTEKVRASWGCEGDIFFTTERAHPAFFFPAGKMQVVHDSTNSFASLCSEGTVEIVVRNTGPTAIQNVVVTDILPAASGIALKPGSVEIRLNGAGSWLARSNPSIAGDTHTWTTTQIPELAQLAPVGATIDGNSTYEVRIRFKLNQTESLAGQTPTLLASATASIACGSAVTSPGQAFDITVYQPRITVTKTGRNLTAGQVAYSETVYGGAGDVIEWRSVVSNTGNLAAENLRLTDALTTSGGTATISGTGITGTVPLSSGVEQVIGASLAPSSAYTYIITETLGSTCANSNPATSVKWGCTPTSNVTSPGTPFDTASMVMLPDIAGGAQLTQAVTALDGGRARVVVTVSNNGGTAYNPVLTLTLPANVVHDTTGSVTFGGTAADINAVTRTGGTDSAPVFTFTGGGSPHLLRYGENITLTYYVRSTVTDTTWATSFPNLASAESTGNGLDPAPPSAANMTARVDYTTSCSLPLNSSNTVTLDLLTPDLDINLTYPGDVLLTDTSAQNYVFTITNNGDPGSVADYITLDLPGVGSGWTINSITLTTAGSGGTGTGATITTAGAFSTAQVGKLAYGSSAVVTVNAQYSGTPGPLTLVLRARGEARYQNGAATGVYYSHDQAGRRVVGVTTSKTLLSTSEAATTTAGAVLIGEEATFRLRADFFGIEGDITNLVIRDTPADSGDPAHLGLAYVSHTLAAGVNEIATTAATPAAAVVPADIAASRVNFTASTLTAASVNAGADTFAADVVFRTLNVAGNTDGKSLRNNFGVSFTYLGQTFASNDSDDGLTGTVANAGLHKHSTLSVRRPAPAIVKTVRNITRFPTGPFAATAPGHAGDDVEYKIVVTNPVGAERPLYDLSVTDTLPAKINLSASDVGADTDGTLTTIEVANTSGASGLGAALTFDQTNTALPTAGSNFTRLDPGQTITLLYRGKLAGTVTPTEALSNSAKVRGHTLPLPSGSQTAPLGTENTTTGPARLEVTATAATVTVDNITQTKTLEATSDTSSSGTAVYIGEQLHYRLTVQLPQGSITDLVVRDTLPAGLAAISNPTVTIGSAISAGAPTVTPALPANTGGTAASTQIQWAFGARTVGTAPLADRTITIDYAAQVRNDSANTIGLGLTNNASFSYNGTGGTFTNITPVTVTVQAPGTNIITHQVRNVTRSGTFSGAASADAGDVLEYRVTVNNTSATNRSPVYDLDFVSTLPAGLTYVASSTTATTTTGLTGTLGEPDVAGQVLTWGRNQSSPVNLDVGIGSNQFRYTYRATVDASARPAQTYSTALVTTWTSLNGNPGTNPVLASPLGIALGADGTTLGERRGSASSPNTNFRESDSVTVNVDAASGTLAKAKSGDTLPRNADDTAGASPSGFRVGDIITYTVSVGSLNEGTLNDLKITDTLPAGLAFVDTVSITPVSNGGAPEATKPLNYTTPAGANTPAAGATGAIAWNFGNVVNAGDNDSANNTLVVVYRARVVDPSGIAVAPPDQTLNNSAVLAYQRSDNSVYSPASPSVAAIVARQPQLTLAKAVASPAADALGNYVRRPGDTASFTLTVTNTGTAPAYNIRLTDTLPAGMRTTAPVLTAAVRNGADVLATQTAPVWTAGTGEWVFDLADTEPLLPAQTLVLTYTGTVDADATKGATLVNTATINRFFSLPSGHAEAASRRQYAAVGPATRSLVVGLRIDGSVYHDLAPNNAKDVGEDWSGATKPTVYANLVTTISGNPAVFRTVQVDPGTGLFAFDYLPPVSYTIVVTNSATATTASRPRNWLFQSPTTGSIAANLVGASADLANQDLGLNQGSYAAPAILKAKSGATLPVGAPVNGYRVGDLVTYTVDVNPQEGALTSYQVTDTLPAGLAFVATSSIAPVSPTTARYTYTTPAGANTPAAGATGAITWNFGAFTNAIAGPVTNATPAAIAAANTLRITYTARVIASGTGNIAAPAVSPASTDTTGLVNSAAVGYTNPAPISAAASAGPSVVSLDVSQPRVTVAKVLLTPALNRIAPGGTGQFQVTVTNNGTAPAYNLVLADTLPAGMRGTAPVLVSTVLNGSSATVTPVWTSGTGDYRFTLGNTQALLPGQTFVATYTFTVDSAATRGATLTNEARVTAFYSLPANDAQAASRRTYAAVGPATADVIVGIRVSGYVYSDLQPNNTRDGAEDWSGATKPTVYVNLLDNLGAVYASATVAPGTGAFSFTNLPAGDYTLIATDSATSTVATRPLNWPFQNPGTGSYAFTLSNADVTRDFGLYQGSLAAPVIAKSKSGDTLPLASPASGFRIGDLVTYAVDIQPQEGALTSFVVSDTLPAGLAFVETVSIAQVSGAARFTYAPPAGPAADATGAISWNFGAFTNAALGIADNTLRITYTARVVDSGGVAAPAASPAATMAARVNSAGVAYDKPAPDAGAKSAGPATASIDVKQPRLVIAKTRLTPVAHNIVLRGETAGFRLTVTNNGDGPAYNAVVSDTLPAGLRTATPSISAATLNGASATLAAPAYDSGTGVWTLSLSDAQILLPGQTLVVDYVVTVDADAAQGVVITNSARVDSYASKASADTTHRRVYAATSPSAQSLVVGVTVAGSVYHELIPNDVKDATEDWTTGTPVYVNLVTNNAVSIGGFSLGANQVLRSVAVPVGTGEFSFGHVPPGSYRIIVTNTAAATSAVVPATWTFDTPSSGAITPLAVSNADISGQNLGLWQGRVVSGLVYNDAAPFGSRQAETWAAGTPVVVNLVDVYGAPVVHASAAVPAGAGTFSFTNVPPGEYRLVVAPAGQTTATTAGAPSGWVFVNPTSGQIGAFTLATTDVTGQEFGLTLGRTISGSVFNDTNPNGSKDGFEDWTTGTPVYVNLVSTTNVVLASASVPIGAGTYSFTNIAPGDYRVIVTNAPGSAVATQPPSWLFRNPAAGSLSVTIAGTDATGRDFALFRGRTLAGRVFRDNGAGGATANNGAQSGAESGIGGVTVRLLSATTAILDITQTNGSGDFVLRIPAETADGATLIVEEINPASHVSTGGQPGDSGGTYNLATDRLTFVYNDADVAGVRFADVPVASFINDGAQTILPGATATYRHVFKAGTAGVVTFTTAATATPSLPWGQVLVRDLDADGVIDAGEPVLAGAGITVAAGEEIALILKDSSPPNAGFGARQSTVITAAFAYANSALSETLARGDITTVGPVTASGLQLSKVVDKTNATPGEVLTYTITYVNAGAENLTDLFIDDRTPAYTELAESASYGVTPAGLTNGTITEPAVGTSGTLRWTFGGELSPGATGTVIFKVRVQQ